MQGRLTIIGVAAGLLLAPAPAQGATKVGQTFVPTTFYNSEVTHFQLSSPANTSYSMPSAGVITSWSFQPKAAGIVPAMKLKIMRSAGMVNQFKVIGESTQVVPVAGSLNTFPTRIAVQLGDRLGFTSAPMATVTSPTAGFSEAFTGGEATLGDQRAYAIPAGDAQLDVSAQLEADADGDGFGDETQDGCPTDASTQLTCPDRVGPETSIDKAPKKVKAKGRKAKVTIEFSAGEKATFECTLDGEMSACVSPFKAKLTKGKHRFSVVATDSAGNAGPPARAAIKVKRKTKR